MTANKTLAPLFIMLVLSAPCAQAQQSTDSATAEGNATAATPEQSASEREGTEGEKNSETGNASQGDDNESPFDYRSSEEISEDLSVSFPVDI